MRNELRAYLDAQVLAALLEQGAAADVYGAIGRLPRTVSLFTSELTLMEVLVGPEQRHEEDLIRRYDELFTKPEGLTILTVDTLVLRLAAKERARHPWMTANDAIHVVSARVADAQCWLTYNPNWARLGTSQVRVLSPR